ncbi:MAG: hypothetical protein ACRCUQ_04410 [Alphaproteobacteria bacterium]
MSKKIVSSLIIASCCLNSLPVYAGKNFSLGEQKQHRKTQSKRSNFLEKQEIDFSNQRRANSSGPMDPKVLLAGLTFLSLLRANNSAPTENLKKSKCDTKEYSQKKLSVFFASPGATHAYILPVPSIRMFSSGEIEADYGSMALSLNDFHQQIESKERNFFASSVPSGGTCAIYQTKLEETPLFGLGDRNEAGTLETFAKRATEERFSDFFNSRNKQHIVLPKGGIFGFVNLLPNIEGDKGKGIFKASLGHNRFSLSAYNAEKISKPHLLAFYNQEKTVFALRNQDDYIELRTEPGNQLAQLGNEATHFLRSLFEGNVVKNYFPEEGTVAPTTEPFLPPEVVISLTPEPNLSISYSTTGAPMLPPIQRQLPEANSNDYNFKNIGIGSAAVVGSVAVVGGVVWLAKKCCGKQKRSNRRQGDRKISLPIISYTANSSQESRSLVIQGNQDMLREPADGAAIAKAETELYEPPRTDERPRPPTYVEIGEASQDLFSGRYFGSTDSGYSGAASTYLEMHPMPKKTSPSNTFNTSNAYVNAPEVPPRPTSKESNYDTPRSHRISKIVQA